MLSLYLSFLDDESDCELFKEIYTTYQQPMFYIANSILNNSSESEDVVHDVFLKVASKYMGFIKSLPNQQDVRNYLFKSAKNTALNTLRNQKQDHVSLDEIDDMDFNFYDPLTSEDFLKELCTHADYEMALNAIRKLDKKYSDVLYYHFVLEMTVPDVAKLLNRKVSTVKKQLVRGKKLLFSYLNISKGNEEPTGVKDLS